MKSIGFFSFDAKTDTESSTANSHDVALLTFRNPDQVENNIHSLSSTQIPKGFLPFCETAIVTDDKNRKYELCALVDTGALVTLMKKKTLPDNAMKFLDQVTLIRGISGNEVQIPVVEISLTLANVFNNKVRVGLVDTLPNGIDLLVANGINLQYMSIDFTSENMNSNFAGIITRSMLRKQQLNQKVTDKEDETKETHKDEILPMIPSWLEKNKDFKSDEHQGQDTATQHDEAKQDEETKTADVKTHNDQANNTGVDYSSLNIDRQHLISH